MAKEKYYDPLSDMAMIKESLMSLFCDTEDLTRLIMPTIDNDNFTWEQNWYGGTFNKNIYGKTEITTLIGHCFDTPYIEGTVTDNRCAIFIETYLTKVDSQKIKQVGVDIFIVSHKDSVRLSDEDKKYYKSIGIYGNRVDCAMQVINSTINNQKIMEAINKKYSIGDLTFTERNPVKQYVPGTKFYGRCLSYTYNTFYQRKDNIR
jgi:hypothetical protein